MTARRGRRSSVTGVHADWLRLVEPNGPFLTLPVLRRVWPNGLDHVDADTRAEVRRRLADFDADDPASLTAWIEWVLTDLLAYGRRLHTGPQVPATLAHVVAEHGVVLRPDHVLDDGAGHPRLLVTVHPHSARLDARPAGDRWSATPVERLALLCRATGVDLGLATSGLSWVLVWAPKDGASGTAAFAADLFSEEPVLLDAFTSVLGARRFFAVAEPDRLEVLLAESASAQAEVTGKLGQQVRQAVELLVTAMSRADRERDGGLLMGIDPHHVYEAAVAVLMRLVLLLYAEERGLLPLGDDLYDRTLAASTLLDQLREVQAETGDEPLERSQTSWHRLLALFRAVHGGITHDRLRIPAYGGGLFDPDRFPFLEGRRPGEAWHETPAEPLPVDDLTVLAMLSALQELRFAEGGVTETRRLTYRALDVEQVGHVYEGLLDHSAVAVEQAAVGLIGRAGNEPEVTLDELAHHASRGRDAFVAWLTETTGVTARRIERALDDDVDADTTRLLRAACDNDEALTERLTPYVHLLRRDLRGLPTVFPAGSMYVTQTGAKRDSGTAYTTKELADEVVEHALAPLVYSPGPAEGADPGEWKLRAAAELLDLKVCDPAVGSGAILVAACRYLADRLVEAWTAEGAPEAGGDPEEVRITARRAVADRCLYGVDRDPMAVEMAKLSLWLVTLSKERPFSFLDHALKSGDSLLGITELDQLRALHLDPAVGRAKVGLSLKPDAVDDAVARAIDLRRRLEATPVVTVRDAEEKARLNAKADAALSALQTVADLVVGCALRAELPGQPPPEDQVAASAPLVAAALDADEPVELRGAALAQIDSRARQALDAGRPDVAPKRVPLHWPLAFPEVFVNRGHPGFDGMVGNPPFLGANRISEVVGEDINALLGRRYPPFSKRVDLAAYFFRLAFALLGTGRCFGLLSTNTIAQGQTRKGGLDAITALGGSIYRARPSFRWPGPATVVATAVWIQKGEWGGMRSLGGNAVAGITTLLEPATRADDLGVPRSLQANVGICHTGCTVWGEEFILDDPVASAFVGESSDNERVLRRAIGGQDLNSLPSPGPSRWVIDFGEEDDERVVARYGAPYRHLRDGVRDWRRSLDERKYRRITTTWWKHWHPQHAMYERIATANADRVLARARNSDHNSFFFVESDTFFLDTVIVVIAADFATFGCLQSAMHDVWIRRYASSLGSGLRYGAANCFDNFPLPSRSSLSLSDSGRSFYQLRERLMISLGIGATELARKINDETDVTPAELRKASVELDLAVLDAYGWSNLDLDHGFHDTPQGVRFTLGPAARTEVLDRLLELNHARYADEVAAGLHDKKRTAKGRKQKPADDAPTLL